MSVLLKDLGNGIKSVIINDPKTYNSLSFKTLGSLIKIFKKLNNDNKTHVIVISGNGKGFSAGHNLKEVKSLKGRSKYLKLFNLCSKLMIDIVECRKPVIAKVHGSAYAAGCQLAASCDLTYSSSDAKFATPGVNIGLFCSTPMVAVSRSLGRKKTMEMLLTGESMNAEDAVSFGLINKNVPLNELEITVLNFAKLIASKPTSTVRIGKEAFYKQAELPIEKAYKYTSEVMAQNMLKKDAKAVSYTHLTLPTKA